MHWQERTSRVWLLSLVAFVAIASSGAMTADPARLTGGKVVFSSDRVQPPQLFVQQVGATTPPVQLTDGWFGARHPKWSADGQFVVYITRDVIVGTSSPADVLEIITANGSSVLTVWGPTIGASSLGYPQWSDDGTAIVVLFTRDDGSRGIGLIRFGGPYEFESRARTQPVPADPARPLNPGEPVFSHDGKTIYFAADTPDAPGQLFRVDANGGTPEPVLDDSGVQLRRVYAPSMAPDGSRLLYNSEMWKEDAAAFQDEEILEYDFTTRKVRRVTSEPGNQYGFYAKNGRGEMLVQSNNPAAGQYALFLQIGTVRVPLWIDDPGNLWKESGDWWKPKEATGDPRRFLDRVSVRPGPAAP